MTQNKEDHIPEDNLLKKIPLQYGITEEQINSAWGNAHFGGINKVWLIGDTLLKIAGGYCTGATALSICQYLGLVGRNRINPTLTKKGKRVMYHLNKVGGINHD